jgi:hypothetical protein
VKSLYMIRVLLLVVGTALLGACRNEGEGLVAPPIGATITAEDGKHEKLSTQQAILAIAERARLERAGRTPTETFIRRYNTKGEVVEELVKSDTVWVKRQSTLPAHLATIPLKSFVVDGEVASSRMSTSLKVTSGSTLINGINTTFLDSLYSDTTSLVEYGHRISSNDQLTYASDLWWANSTQVGNFSVSTAASWVGLDPESVYYGGDEIVQYTLTGSDYQEALAGFQSEWDLEFGSSARLGSLYTSSLEDCDALPADAMASGAFRAKGCAIYAKKVVFWGVAGGVSLVATGYVGAYYPASISKSYKVLGVVFGKLADSVDDLITCKLQEQED